MKRFGVRAVGLGLALAAGSVLAADDWRPGGGAPAELHPVGGPALLPPTVRAQRHDAPIWVSADTPAPVAELPPPEPFVPGVGPSAVMPAAGTGAPSELVGPRVAPGGADPLGALPPIPVAAQPDLHASPVAEL